MTPYELEVMAREARTASENTPSPHARLILRCLYALLQHEADKEAYGRVDGNAVVDAQ